MKYKDEVKSENTKLYNRLLNLEAHSRRDILLVYGVPESHGESEKHLRQWWTTFFKDVLNFENPDALKVECIHRKGPANKSDTSRSRPIIVKFHSFLARMEVWNKRSVLQQTSFSMAEDYPPEFEMKRKQLYPIMREARKQGMRASLKVDKLIVEGKVYFVDTLRYLPSSLQECATNYHKDSTFTFYFGRSCPLSNFYPSSFTLDGHTFSCSEQFLQYSKAMMFDDQVTANRILSTSIPEEQKKLGRQVANFEWRQWCSEAPDVVRRGIAQKFEENPHLQEFLKQTGETEIVECASRDKLWGIGIGLYSKDRGDKSKWTGRNEMGKILMEVRKDIV